MERRVFIKSSGAIFVCTCLGSTVLSSCKAISGTSDTPIAPLDSFSLEGNEIKLDISKTPELKEIGGSVKISINNSDIKIIVARIDEDKFLAFTDKCTHRGGELEYNHEKGQFRCVSFGHSTFAKDGDALKGPAKSSITPYLIEANQDNILSINIGSNM